MLPHLFRDVRPRGVLGPETRKKAVLACTLGVVLTPWFKFVSEISPGTVTVGAQCSLSRLRGGGRRDAGRTLHESPGSFLARHLAVHLPHSGTQDPRQVGLVAGSLPWSVVICAGLTAPLMSGRCEGEGYDSKHPTSYFRVEEIQAHCGVPREPGPLSISQMCFSGSGFRRTWWERHTVLLGE